MDKKQLKSFLHGSAVSMVGVGTLGIMNYFIRRTLSLNLSETDFGFFYTSSGKKLNFFRDDVNAGRLFVSYWLLEVTCNLQRAETALSGHVKS
jgi:hypothetical protein